MMHTTWGWGMVVMAVLGCVIHTTPCHTSIMQIYWQESALLNLFGWCRDSILFPIDPDGCYGVSNHVNPTTAMSFRHVFACIVCVSTKLRGVPSSIAGIPPQTVYTVVMCVWLCVLDAGLSSVSCVYWIFPDHPKWFIYFCFQNWLISLWSSVHLDIWHVHLKFSVYEDLLLDT